MNWEMLAAIGQLAAVLVYVVDAIITKTKTPPAASYDLVRIAPGGSERL